MDETASDQLTVATSFRDSAYKRPLDLLMLFVAHIALAPLWVALWIGIPMMIYLNDRGPIFYRQRRVGRGGREFDILKFRSMVPDAEKDSGAIWATPSDARTTRVGRLLRKTALDELPQLINILRGEMSFVGPRSERPELHQKIVADLPEFDKRLSVRPGLTGLAQLRGDYDDPPATKLERDLTYIEQQSLYLDLKLVFLSVVNTLSARWDHRRPR